MSAGGAEVGPPGFRYGEVVRIAGTLGDAYWLGEREYPSELFLGWEVTVHEAFPAADRKGWLIGVRVPDPAGERGPALEGLAFPEDLLEKTGLVRAWERGEYLGRVPLASVAETPPFRDPLRVDLLTNVVHPGESDLEEDEDESDEDEAEWDRVESALAPIRERATARVRALLDLDYEVEWVEEFGEEPGFASLMDFIEPPGDVVAAYERLTGSPATGWAHGESDHRWPLSAWHRPLTGNEPAAFLAPGITWAEVECRHYSSPRSHSRRGPLHPELESYLEAGPRAQWQHTALQAGFEESERDEGEYEEDIFRLRQVLVLVGTDSIKDLDALLTKAQPWATEALASVAEESTRRGFTPAAISPDVIAIAALLATPLHTGELEAVTPFRDELASAIATVARRRQGA